jgi:hypothetical protein
LAASLLASAAAAKDCVPADLPPGVRMPERPGCKADKPAAASESRAREGRSPGTIELGNGTELRVGGRARLESDTRR